MGVTHSYVFYDILAYFNCSVPSHYMFLESIKSCCYFVLLPFGW